MINKLKDIFVDVSLSNNRGKYLADKSYGFDTVYFISKFILYNSPTRWFNKGNLKKKAIKYIEDLFQLTPGTAGAVNYYLESVNLLTYANILKTENNQDYFICEPEILGFVADMPENAYVFLYMLTYMTFKNDGALLFFEEYAKSRDVLVKEKCVFEIYDLFVKKSVSIENKGTNWSKQLVKYSLIVLGYANKLNYISRTLNIKNTAVTIKDISLNVAGTRTPLYLPKKNDYLQKFNVQYVKHYLKDFLFVSENISFNGLQVVDNIAGGLAELKLAMLDDDINKSTVSDQERQQYLDTVVRTRNQVIQRQFRKGLFDNNAHICPICGFSFEKFLIASHIKPYAKCENTYDAINHFNGLLLCPNHDKLFEDAHYMTVDYKSGKIILSKEAEQSKEYGCLKGLTLDKQYIENDRRYYLEWHNQRFIEHNN